MQQALSSPVVCSSRVRSLSLSALSAFFAISGYVTWRQENRLSSCLNCLLIFWFVSKSFCCGLLCSRSILVTAENSLVNFFFFSSFSCEISVCPFVASKRRIAENVPSGQNFFFFFNFVYVLVSFHRTLAVNFVSG